MNAVLPWKDEPFVLPVQFEDLVGSRGGGDDAAQMHCLQAIRSFVVEASAEKSPVPPDLATVARNL